MKYKATLSPSKSLLTLFFAFFVSLLAAQEQLTPVDYVSTMVGTLSDFALSNGNTYPVIARPWGMNAWTPQTGKMGDGWQYSYNAHKIRGFKQTHQPSPWINDYGQFSLMPTMGRQPSFDEEKRASYFSHKSESATPYYYAVYLSDYDTHVEITPTERAALMRIRFGEPAPDCKAFLEIDAFDGLSEIVQSGSRRIMGYSTKNSGGVPDNFRCYFVVEFDRDVVAVLLLQDSLQSLKGGSRMAVELQTEDRDDDVLVRVASSFISPEQALLNLSEVEGKSFDEVRAEGRRTWNNTLGRILVSGGTDRELRTFYSCLYRSLLFPRRFYEYDAQGVAHHYSPYNGKVLPGYMYTDTGFWDTFRALMPLLSLVYPEESKRMQEGWLNVYRESGFFPEWSSPGHRGCMIGNHSASVLTEAFLAGCGPTDTATLISGLLCGAHSVHPTISSVGRVGHQYYDRLDYVPCDVGIAESAARTLEYAYDDWCIGRLLQHLGDKRSKTYLQRARNYRHIFDPATGWMRGKRQDGSFVTPFSPVKWGGDFTEGNALHYTWSVFHDVAGLIDLMGGDHAFETRMDSIFSMAPIFDDTYYGFVIHEIREMQIAGMGQYAHGNQPMQHFLYLYNYIGQPWKTQQAVRDVMSKLYTPDPDGYCGDEDNGQTSAWYVFSALGFYPVCPGSGEYVIGSPLFHKAVILQPEDKKVCLESSVQRPDHPYIRSITVNGKPYDKTYFRLSDLRRGALIHFEMSDEPNMSVDTPPSSRPFSMSKRDK